MKVKGVFQAQRNQGLAFQISYPQFEQ